MRRKKEDQRGERKIGGGEGMGPLKPATEISGTAPKE